MSPILRDLIKLLKTITSDISPIPDCPCSKEELAFRLLLFKFCTAKRLPFFRSDSDTHAAREKLSEYYHSELFSVLNETNIRNTKIPPNLLETVEIEDIGFLYESLLGREHSKKGGIFYTPRPIAAHIVSVALDHMTGMKSTTLRNSGTTTNVSLRNTDMVKDSSNMEGLACRAREDQISLLPTILDPACGCGVFLLEALSKLCHRSPCIDPETILKESIFGVELDKGAAELCRFLLLLKLLELFPAPKETFPDLSANIISGNTLLSPEKLREHALEDLPKFHSLSFSNSFAQVFKDGGFDCIVGNPPYGLSRDGQLSAAENAALKKIYAQYLCGKPNKYMLFMARAHELLKAGGVCTLIVPNSWLGIRGGKNLRKFLLSEEALVNISILEFPAFDEPSVETVIVTTRKATRSSAIRIHHAADITNLDGDSSATKIDTTICMQTPGLIIPTRWNEKSERLLKAINEHCIPLRDLSSYFQPLIALQVYASGKGDPPQTNADVKNHIFHSKEKISDDYHPYLEGADIERYRITWSGNYLKWGPWVSEYQPIERFTAPRILIREILAPEPHVLRCAYIDKLSFYNRSVLHIIAGPEACADDMLALLAILNSSLASEIIMLLGQKSQRKLFPKIVNDDLLNFPLPKEWKASVSLLSAGAKERCNQSNKNSSQYHKDLEDELDAIVQRMYF